MNEFLSELDVISLQERLLREAPEAIFRGDALPTPQAFIENAELRDAYLNRCYQVKNVLTGRELRLFATQAEVFLKKLDELSEQNRKKAVAKIILNSRLYTLYKNAALLVGGIGIPAGVAAQSQILAYGSSYLCATLLALTALSSAVIGISKSEADNTVRDFSIKIRELEQALRPERVDESA